jgi:hypothetical protein
VGRAPGSCQRRTPLSEEMGSSDSRTWCRPELIMPLPIDSHEAHMCQCRLSIDPLPPGRNLANVATPEGDTPAERMSSPVKPAPLSMPVEY